MAERHRIPADLGRDSLDLRVPHILRSPRALIVKLTLILNDTVILILIRTLNLTLTLFLHQQRPGHNVISHGPHGVRHHHPNHTNHHHTNHLHHSHHHGAGQHDQRHMMQMDRNPVREQRDRNYRIETQCQITEQERQQLEQQRIQQERAHERASLAKQQERAKRQQQFAVAQCAHTQTHPLTLYLSLCT